MKTKNHTCTRIPKYMKETLKRIGWLFRQLRRVKNLTQRDVASKLNCSQSLISRIERGLYNPKVELLEKIIFRSNPFTL